MVRYRTEKIQEEPEPRRICDKALRVKLRGLGYDIEGYDRQMEKILKSKGFGLPMKNEDGVFHYMIDWTYLRFDPNYADCLAGEIILLHELKLM